MKDPGLLWYRMTPGFDVFFCTHDNPKFDAAVL